MIIDPLPPAPPIDWGEAVPATPSDPEPETEEEESDGTS